MKPTPRSFDYHGLHVLADDDPRWPLGPVEQARAACEGGARVVQLRAKNATDSQALAWAREIRTLSRAAGVRFVVNDRFDLALCAEADGVHLGQNDLPPAAIPREARTRLAVGRSTHTPEQLEAAAREDVDYLAFGPVFGTTSKQSDYADRGLPALEGAVTLAAPHPLIAIGGITARNVADVAGSGAAGFAVISGIAGASDPVAATRDLAERFDAARRVRTGERE